jgi:hypothetical protein
MENNLEYYVHFHIPGMSEDYSGRPIYSARIALDRVKRLSKKYHFKITKIQERKGKNTREISQAELEILANG